jgi:hypothetical protein
MTRGRIIALVTIFVIAAVVYFTPGSRDELAWRWAQAQDQTGDYNRYLTDWPAGRHVNEAKTLYNQRKWAADKRRLIREAVKDVSRTNASGAGADAYKREQRLRREMFCWKQATIANTLDGYNAYLDQYPAGQYVAQARLQIASLNNPSNPTGSATNSTAPH